MLNKELLLMEESSKTDVYLDLKYISEIGGIHSKDRLQVTNENSYVLFEDNAVGDVWRGAYIGCSVGDILTFTSNKRPLITINSHAKEIGVDKILITGITPHVVVTLR